MSKEKLVLLVCGEVKKDRKSPQRRGEFGEKVDGKEPLAGIKAAEAARLGLRRHGPLDC